MKNRHYFILAFTAVVVALSIGCKKLEVEGNYVPTSTKYDSNPFLTQQAAMPEENTVFLVDTIFGDTIIYFADSTSITFNRQTSVLTKAGAPYFGFVTFCFKPAKKPSEIIFEDKPTVADFKLLESAGAYFFRVKDEDGNTLRLQNYTIRINAGDTLDREMEMFLPSVQQNGLFTWENETPGLSEALGFTAIGDTLINPMDSSLYNSKLNSYNPTYLNDTLGWINCDKFYNSSAPRTVMRFGFAAKDELLLDEMVIYVVFKDFLGVMQGSRSGANEFELANIPVGEDVKVVIVAFQGIDIFYKLYDTEVRNGHRDNFEFGVNDETTETELKSIIQSMDL